MIWHILPIPTDPVEAQLAIRLNSLGSLYFFVSYTLQKNKLNNTLHRMICDTLEKERPRFLLEMPRGSYKTTIVTEGRTIWKALPFDERDEAMMRALGYDDTWIAWMRRVHNPSTRQLIVSETIDNAGKLGIRFDWHFHENTIFKTTFPEIIPTAKETWNSDTKQIRCSARGANGEGTFDFLGVGAALQSRHYIDITEDDVVGKDALESELVMDKTIDYHRLLIGAFESYHQGSWTVVGNRWSPNDLGGWIREHQKDFYVESHGALGGCCTFHVAGQPIFPEELSKEVLAEIREIQGPVIYSHQYLNLPLHSEECVFNKEWLRYYEPVPAPDGSRRHMLHHLVGENQIQIPDLNPAYLQVTMVVDPNHAGEQGRSRHAIVVTGLDPSTDRIYLLDLWAESASTDAMLHNLYRMADLWNLREVWLETIGAQGFLKYHLEYRNRVELHSPEHKEGLRGTPINLRVRELKADRTKNAKRTRIEALEPLFREGRIWCRADQLNFLHEYDAFPGGRTWDVLDCLAYAPQTWNAHYAQNILKSINERRNRFAARRSVTGY